MAESSRNLKTKAVLEQYKIPKEIEKGETCASVVRKHGIAKQTIPNWLKNLDKWDFLQGIPLIESFG